MLRKITAEEFNVSTKMKSPCTPPIQLLDGTKTQVSDNLGVLIPRGMYKNLVFIPNAWLGEIRWNRIFKNQTYDQAVVDTGVVFMFP